MKIEFDLDVIKANLLNLVAEKFDKMVDNLTTTLLESNDGKNSNEARSKRKTKNSRYT